MAELMYSENDIKIIKGLFADNDYLLKLLRRLFFGDELTEQEKKIITDTFKDEASIEVLRRKVYSTKNYDTQIGHVSDFWMGAESQIFGASRDTIAQAVESKSIVEEMFKKAFNLLKDPNGQKVNLEYNPISLMSDPLQTGLIARNLYMKAIETALFTVKTIAGQKDETPEQALKRLNQDSTK